METEGSITGGGNSPDRSSVAEAKGTSGRGRWHAPVLTQLDVGRLTQSGGSHNVEAGHTDPNRAS